jgi:hypothetical protein
MNFDGRLSHFESDYQFQRIQRLAIRVNTIFSPVTRLKDAPKFSFYDLCYDPKSVWGLL